MIPHFASKVKFVFAVECKGFGNCLNQDFQDEIGESRERELAPTARRVLLGYLCGFTPRTGVSRFQIDENQCDDCE